VTVSFGDIVIEYVPPSVKASVVGKCTSSEESEQEITK
jgi:hypothetical protein